MTRWSTIRFGASLLGLLLAVSPCRQSSAAALDLDKEIERALREEGLTGAVWSTIDTHGHRVGASGVANADTGESLRPDHRIHVGSVAKSVLAIGVLRLVSEGRLSLDAPVSDLLPELAFDNPWSDSDPIRVRHLLAHTAGIDNLRLWQAFSRTATHDSPLQSAFVDKRVLQVRSRPGTRFSYSNMGYTLLGMIIEAVTAQRYESYLDQQLLRPLSMHDSSFQFVSQTGASADPRLVMGHFEQRATHPAVPMFLRPASQFTTTAADMARFALFLMGDGRIDGQSFVARTLLDQLATPRDTEAARAGLLSVGHGLALVLRDRHGVVGQCHPGTTVGFNAMLCMFPEQQKAFFVAINTDSEGADYARFDALLIAALDLARPAPLPITTPSTRLADWDGIYVPAPNGMATLAGIDTVLNFVRVKAHDGMLRIKPFQSDERWLAPLAGRVFRATDRTTPSHVLLQSSEGATVLSDGLRSWERAPLPRMLLLWSSLAAGLLGLGYVFVAGIVRTLAGGMRKRSTPLWLPLLSIIALVVPLPFFLAQSFLDVGDVTIASVLLAIVTGLLPLAMAIGLVDAVRHRRAAISHYLDIVALLAVLQCLVVVGMWNLLPLRLWSL